MKLDVVLMMPIDELSRSYPIIFVLLSLLLLFGVVLSCAVGWFYPEIQTLNKNLKSVFQNVESCSVRD